MTLVAAGVRAWTCVSTSVPFSSLDTFKRSQCFPAVSCPPVSTHGPWRGQQCPAWSSLPGQKNLGQQLCIFHRYLNHPSLHLARRRWAEDQLGERTRLVISLTEPSAHWLAHGGPGANLQGHHPDGRGRTAPLELRDVAAHATSLHPTTREEPTDDSVNEGRHDGIIIQGQI